MSPARLRPPILCAVFLALALFSGCGSEDPEPVKVARPGVIEVRQTDFRFQPQALRVAAGRWPIRAVNTGRLPHTLRLVRDERERVSITTVLPGRAKTASVYLVPGTYRMVCVIGNHEELGMYGTVKVNG